MMWFGGWWLMWLVPLLLVVGLVFLLVDRFSTPRRQDEEDRALAILRERYARGEIDDEEYERLRAKLK